MQSQRIDRREFLQSGLMAASLIAAGRLPLLARETDGGSGIDGSDEPYAVKPIRGYLPTFSPSDAQGQERPDALHYDIVHWSWGPKGRGTHTNSVVGKIDIVCKESSDRVVYEVAQSTKIGGVDNVMKAEIVCNVDALHSIQSWRLKSHEVGPDGKVDPLSKLAERGRCEDGKIRIDSEHDRCDRTATRSVVTQWHVPGLLARNAGRSLRLNFDLLRDASLLKPNQRLTYDGPVKVPVKGGRTLTLDSYAQTGEGILPTHYLLDDKRRVQLVTCSFLSWALQG
ncbi:MAG: hypothetical protein JW741_14765 [Sedimentisphaerales bacterium]|nr:hypothetical protein [Sedimentisphaerales bacterium]